MERPLLIGVAGGSGSGKSTVVRKLVEALPSGSASVVHHDAYYRDLRHLTLEERTTVNFDHPDSLETELLVQHLDRLLSGRPAELPVYDFGAHSRTDRTERVDPTPFIVLDGILVLAEEALRSRMSLRVFVHTSEEDRLRRRTRRDVRERGRTVDSVEDQFARTVRPMHEQFVAPSRSHADVTIVDGGFNEPAIASLVERVLALPDSARADG